MTTEKPKKKEKIFCCNLCHFNTFKKTDYDRHVSTIKHKNNVFATPDNEKNKKKYKCKCCEKEYNDRAGLWRHKKKCINLNIPFNNEEEKIQEICDKDLILILIKQTSELLEVVKNGTYNTSNSHNKIVEE